jgi:hypothetical protein
VASKPGADIHERHCPANAASKGIKRGDKHER